MSKKHKPRNNTRPICALIPVGSPVYTGYTALPLSNGTITYKETPPTPAIRPIAFSGDGGTAVANIDQGVAVVGNNGVANGGLEGAAIAGQGANAKAFGGSQVAAVVLGNGTAYTGDSGVAVAMQGGVVLPYGSKGNSVGIALPDASGKAGYAQATAGSLIVLAYVKNGVLNFRVGLAGQKSLKPKIEQLQAGTCYTLDPKSNDFMPATLPNPITIPGGIVILPQPPVPPPIRGKPSKGKKK